MSTYEPRADIMRQGAANFNWRISWRKQNARVYATVVTSNGNPLCGGYDHVRDWLKQYYKDPVLTSGGFGRWTFLVYDLIELLKGEHNAS